MSSPVPIDSKHKWSTCYLSQVDRNKVGSDISRSSYQRDYDRIIFSSAFRRLQNKTQVFPLPGTAFVHNRLTHSLEVASVGRSIGTIVGRSLAVKYFDKDSEDYQFYFYELSNVIGAACLAHDLGNPAFGHSGEAAISHFFGSFQETPIEGTKLRDIYADAEWEDLTNFEGNANALRILTQSFHGKAAYGMGLTQACLAAILKYPCESIATNKRKKHTKKYGFFQSEKAIFNKLVSDLNFIQEGSDPIVYRRHPFVYLVEAADDICYNIIDMEDAHRLGILSKETVSQAFLNVIEELNNPTDDFAKIQLTYQSIGDNNEAISYLRAKAINTLTLECCRVFLEQEEQIINSEFDTSLFSEIESQAKSLVHIEEMSLHQIYRHPRVLEIEVAGFNVMSGLLEMYLPAVLKEFKSPVDKTIVSLIPSQFRPKEEDTPYLKTMNVLDHISSMTDAFAVEHYRKLKGIEI